MAEDSEFEPGAEESTKVALHLKPVRDLLWYCRKPNRGLQDAASLAPKLLLDDSQEQGYLEAALPEELADLLWEALCNLRGEQSERVRLEHNESAALNRFEHDFKKNSTKLTALSLIWAFFIEQVSAEKLGQILKQDRHRVYERVKSTLPEVKRLVDRRALQVAAERKKRLNTENKADPEHAWEKSQPDTMSTNATDAADTGTPDRKMQVAPELADGFQFVGNHIFIQTNAGSSIVERHDAEPAAPAKRGYSKDEDRLFGVLAALFIVLTIYLQYAAPLPISAAILLCSTWRTGVYGWRTVRAWIDSDEEQRWWSVFALLPWLVLTVMTVLLLHDVPPLAASPLQPIDRTGVALRGLCVAALLLVLGALDVLFWIDRKKPGWGLWRHLVSHAEFAAKHRWEAVGFGWIALVAVVLAFFMASVF